MATDVERAKSEEQERHLRRTIDALRDELERLKISDQEKLERALAAANDESRQLGQTV